MKAWAKDFYDSTAWRETRAAYLLSQQNICERCGDIAKVVHHRTYLTPQNINDTRLTLSWTNLEALCQGCHNREHHRNERQSRYEFDADGNIKRAGHDTTETAQRSAQQSPPLQTSDEGAR